MTQSSQVNQLKFEALVLEIFGFDSHIQSI